jgi:hypothetical protein
MMILKMSLFVFYNLHALHLNSAKRKTDDLPHLKRKHFPVFLPHFKRTTLGLTRVIPEPRTRV